MGTRAASLAVSMTKTLLHKDVVCPRQVLVSCVFIDFPSVLHYLLRSSCLTLSSLLLLEKPLCHFIYFLASCSLHSLLK